MASGLDPATPSRQAAARIATATPGTRSAAEAGFLDDLWSLLSRGRGLCSRRCYVNAEASAFGCATPVLDDDDDDDDRGDDDSRLLYAGFEIINIAI